MRPEYAYVAFPETVRRIFKTEDPLESPLSFEVARGAVFGAGTGAVAAMLFGWWIDSPREVVRRRIVGQSGFYAGIGATYMAATVGLAQLRGKNDAYNVGFGGSVVGLLMGASRGSIQSALLHSAVLGSGLFILTWGQSQNNAALQVPPWERYKIFGDSLLVKPLPDPYAKHIDAIKSRDAAAKESESE